MSPIAVMASYCATAVFYAVVAAMMFSASEAAPTTLSAPFANPTWTNTSFAPATSSFEHGIPAASPAASLRSYTIPETMSAVVYHSITAHEAVGKTTLVSDASGIIANTSFATIPIMSSTMTTSDSTSSGMGRVIWTSDMEAAGDYVRRITAGVEDLISAYKPGLTVDYQATSSFTVTNKEPPTDKVSGTNHTSFVGINMAIVDLNNRTVIFGNSSGPVYTLVDHDDATVYVWPAAGPTSADSSSKPSESWTKTIAQNAGTLFYSTKAIYYIASTVVFLAKKIYHLVQRRRGYRRQV